MKRRPVIYRSYWEYLVRRVLGPVAIIVAAFAFASVYFMTTREAEMAKIRSTKVVQQIETIQDALERAPE